MRIFLSLLSCYLQLPSIISADSLYQASDPILELDVDTFNSAIYGKKKAHFVEFYSSWCGACIGYAPIFKNFANMHLKTNNAKNFIVSLSLQIISRIFSTELMTKIWESAGSVQFIGLAIQENPATMAWAVCLNGLMLKQFFPFYFYFQIKINFHNDRNVRIVLSRPQHPEAIKHLGTEANNRFIFYARGNPVPLWISPENTKWVDVQEKVMDLIAEVPAVAEPAPINLESVSVEPQAQAPLISHDLNQYHVQLVDLQSTVSYMLYKEIPRREVISGENLKALKQWIHTLMKYIPGTTPIRRLFHRLDEWIQVQEKVTADEWIKKVDEIQVSAQRI
uniref:Thioredoxin domain-containing protein n=1 Tax=Heterorhabditis bacteriophora TaxID=37862 RepID=A0A1I7XGP0_HETBA